MFGSKKAVSFAGEIDTIIGKDTVLKGMINSKGAIRIDGQFEGELQTTDALMIGESARLTAQVKARNATIAGVINGNVSIQDKLELLSTAQLYGDIKTGILIIGEGAVFKGACEMHNGSSGQKELKVIAGKSE